MHLRAGVVAQIKALLAQGLSHEEVAKRMAVKVCDVAEISTLSAVTRAQELFDARLAEAQSPRGVRHGYGVFDELDRTERFHK
jgi:hypothetical protein